MTHKQPYKLSTRKFRFTQNISVCHILHVRHVLGGRVTGELNRQFLPSESSVYAEILANDTNIPKTVREHISTLLENLTRRFKVSFPENVMF